MTNPGSQPTPNVVTGDMNIPAEPWVVTTPDRVRPGALVAGRTPRPSSDESYIASARVETKMWWVPTAETLPATFYQQVVCAVADLLPATPTRAKDPRFPGTCAKCGRGTYTSAFFVEHDGECAP